MKNISSFTNTVMVFTLATTVSVASQSLAGDPIESGKSVSHSSNLWDSHRVDSHAPIGVMGDHTHDAGESMFSYRFGYMEMGEMRDGTRDLSSQDIFRSGFMVAPTSMEMEMHMISMMYAPTDNLTLMAMTNYQFRTMDHISMPGSPAQAMEGSTFSKSVEGWGDLTLAGLLKIYDDNSQRVHLNLGFSVPTGEFNARMYPMQPTTGTWDLLPGITWLWQADNLSGGAQIKGRIHLDENEFQYTYGDTITETTWLAYRLTDSLSISGRLSLDHSSSIDGTDSRIVGPLMSPPMDPANSGGNWLEGGLGLNYLVPDGLLKGHRLAIEGILPLYQDLNGPQMQRDVSVVVGWQKSF